MATKVQPATQQPLFILVRGLLGAYMPGHFKKVKADIQLSGAKAVIAPTDPAGTIFQNANRIARDLPKQIDTGRRLVFLAHSKGGLETLGALLASRALYNQTNAVVLFQTPRRGAPYLKSLFQKEFPKDPVQSIRESIHKAALTAILAKSACQELATNDVLPFVKEIEDQPFTFPVFSYSTFSTRNSGWIELQANRISQIEPGKRNDGVFLTEDQVWQKFSHRELAEIDHAEPTVGSRRIDESLLWRNVLDENGLLPS
ncbi:MAG: hypothetical protein U1E10_01965 [Bdellovibrionales bacterium]|nr:hypothetical protein [Bdellovibrionales bacterium]